MNTLTSVMKYVVAAIIVMVIGGLIGWYVYLHRQIAATDAIDAARGGGNIPSFGGSSGSTNQNEAESIPTTNTPGVPNTSGKSAPRLWHVTKAPVAGFGFASSTTQVFFVEESSGNILKADPSESSVERLTNTLMPKTFDALFAPDGAVIMRSLEGDTIDTFVGTLASTTLSIDSTSTPQMLRGSYLAKGITAIAIGPSHTLAYIVPDSRGMNTVTTSDWKGSVQKKIFTTALSEWNMNILSDGGIVLTQKPSDGIPGYAYSLSSSGALSPILQNLPGLTLLTRKGGARLYGTSDGTLALFAQVSASADSVPLPIRTSADKCVWSSGIALIAYCAVPQGVGNNSLAQRYQGIKHSADAWYKVEVSAGTVEQLFAPDSSLSLDVEKPVIDENDTYISFTNAADKSLWMLRIAP